MVELVLPKDAERGGWIQKGRLSLQPRILGLRGRGAVDGATHFGLEVHVFMKGPTTENGPKVNPSKTKKSSVFCHYFLERINFAKEKIASFFNLVLAFGRG